MSFIKRKDKAREHNSTDLRRHESWILWRINRPGEAGLLASRNRYGLYFIITNNGF